MELILNKYLIDIVQAVEGKTNDVILEQTGEVVKTIQDPPKVQMVTYAVLAGSADEALKRFFDDEAGVIVYNGDVVDRILVGIQAAAQQSIDVAGSEPSTVPAIL